MKRFSLFVAAACVFAISCKKDSGSSDNSKLIGGKWTPVSDIGVFTSNGQTERDTFYFTPASYSDFRTDGKVYSHLIESTTLETSDDTSSYQVKGNLLIASESGSSESDTVQIQTLTKSSFIYMTSFSDDNETEVHTITYKK